MQGTSPRFPGEVLIGLNDRNPQLHDLYRVKIDTGERTFVHTNEGFAGFVTDEELNVRFGVRLTPDGGAETLKPADGGGWDVFMKVKAEDLLTTEPEGFDKTGRILYLSDSRDRDTAALVTIDLDTGQETTVAEDARSDVSDLMVHPTEKDIQAVAFTYDLKKWHVRDPAVGVDLERLSAVADGDIEVVSRTLDDRQWIVAFMTDDGPMRFYRYDRDRKTADFIFVNREALEALPLTKKLSQNLNHKCIDRFLGRFVWFLQKHREGPHGETRDARDHLGSTGRALGTDRTYHPGGRPAQSPGPQAL